MNIVLILLSILTLLLLLLFSRVKLFLSYHNEIRCTIRYLPLRFTLYPRKKTKKRKKAKTAKAKSSHSQAAKKPVTRAPQKERTLRLSDIRLLLRLFSDVLGDILEKASHHVRIRIRSLHLSVGGAENAARAAIEYGILTQATTFFLAYLDDTGFLKPVREKDIDVRVNFLESGYEFSLYTSAECRLIFLIPLIFQSGLRVLKAKNKWTRYRARTAAHRKKNTQKKETDNG